MSLGGADMPKGTGYTVRLECSYYERSSSYNTLDDARWHAGHWAEDSQQRVFITETYSREVVAVVWPKGMRERVEAERAVLLDHLIEVHRMLSDEPPTRAMLARRVL